jgi:L-ribulose-5-phosphate 4-epimerase
MRSLSHPEQRAQIAAAAQRLVQTEVLSHSGHGNMSARIAGTNHMLLTSVSHLEHVTAESLALVTFDGEAVEGSVDPGTREIVGMHACVYRERPDVSSVIHTHSPQATSFALAHVPLPVVYEAFLRFGITEDIPVAKWAPRGSEEAIAFIVETLHAHPGIPAILLGNHGLLAFGQNAQAAAQIIIIMEESAQMTLAARAIGGVKPFPEGALEAERAHMQRYGSA